MSIKKINIAIIGFGEIGQKHLNSLIKLKNKYNINAIFDQKFDKKKKDLAKKHNIKLYKNINYLLKNNNLDYSVICLPSGKHFEFIKKLIKNGINVISEKPLVLKTQEIKKVKSILKKNKKIKLFEVKQLRFSKLIENIYDNYKNKKFGNAHMININIFINRSGKYFNDNSWRGTLKLDGGVLFNQLSHHIDLLFFIFNPKKISKLFFISQKNKNLETEDSGFLIFKMNKKTLVNINFTLNAYKKNFINSFNGMFDFANFSFDFRSLDRLNNFTLKNKFLINKFTKPFIKKDLYLKFYEAIYKNYITGKKNHQLSDIYSAEKVIKFNEDFYKIMKTK